MVQRAFDLIFAVFIVSIIAWFVWEARSWPFHSRLFPWSIGLSILILALVLLGASVRRLAVHINSRSESTRQEALEGLIDKAILWRVVTIGAWIGFFLLGIWLLGFRLGSLILTITFLKFAAGEGYREYLSLGLVNYLFFFLVFDLALAVPLFEGVLSQWFGMEALDKALLGELVNLWPHGI